MTTLTHELHEAETALSLARTPDEQKAAHVRLRRARMDVEADQAITRAFNNSFTPQP